MCHCHCVLAFLMWCDKLPFNRRKRCKRKTQIFRSRRDVEAVPAMVELSQLVSKILGGVCRRGGPRRRDLTCLRVLAASMICVRFPSRVIVLNSSITTPACARLKLWWSTSHSITFSMGAMSHVMSNPLSGHPIELPDVIEQKYSRPVIISLLTTSVVADLDNFLGCPCDMSPGRASVLFCANSSSEVTTDNLFEDIGRSWNQRPHNHL